MKKFPVFFSVVFCIICFSALIGCAGSDKTEIEVKPRIIATTDGEIDDQCSMVRFLLYANEWDIEGIVTSSSQYHWRGHRWAGDDWIEPYLDAYEEIYPNLVLHDTDYPSPEYLRERTVLGNVDAEGEMEKVTPGSELIVTVLLDETDNRPVWLQAWGGTNTIARALKTIEEEHWDKMEYVANKIRLFLIWEQDDTYQKYIRPSWEKYNILSVVSDQFGTIAYQWGQYIPQPEKSYYEADWMKENILNNHGLLCSMYEAHEDGAFRSEGDSPAFMHMIDTGLRNLENPGWGGWGGRYVLVRNNTWLDPIEGFDYKYPEGRYYANTAPSRQLQKANDSVRYDYYEPIWRWSVAFQNDWAARADWCVKSPDESNHQPIVTLTSDADVTADAGSAVSVSVKASDPDGDDLTYIWWQYTEAGTYNSTVTIENETVPKASVIIPSNAKAGDTIHIICEVTDNGEPSLTRYRRVEITVPG